MDSLGLQLQGPAIIGQLNHSQLYHELEGCCRNTYGEETKLPGCLDKIFYFAQLGVQRITDLLKTGDGGVSILSASQLTNKWPHALDAHIHLLHQLTLYLTQGSNKISKRCRNMLEADKRIMNARFWDPAAQMPQPPATNMSSAAAGSSKSKPLKADKMLEDRYKVAKAAARRAAKTRAAGARPTKLMHKPKRNFLP